ncbi:MAG: glycosyltransferase family 39 protein [Anaerolineae bacterium]
MDYAPGAGRSRFDMRAMGTRVGAVLRAHRGALLWGALLFAVALLVRLPNLLQIPRYSDEGLEALWGWEIALGHQWPLTAVDPYDGPLYAYLLAAILKVFGPNILLPRLMIAVAGALTVAATYGLGRSMSSHRGGLFAAAIALTSPTLIILSHIGISNGLTPLFFTLTAAALWKAGTTPGVTRASDWLLALSGLLAALTLQTHPLSVFGLAGLALWFPIHTLWRNAPVGGARSSLLRDLRAWLTRPGPYLALGGFLLGYAPMLIANLRPDSPMFATATNRSYAFGPTLSLSSYLARLSEFAPRIARMIGGDITSFVSPLLPVLLLAGLALVGMILALRRGNGLLVAVMLATLVLMPFLIKEGTVGVTRRYAAYLIPLGAVAIGIAADWLISRLGQFQARGRIYRLAPLSALVVILALAAFPLVTLADYDASTWNAGQTNQQIFAMSVQAEQAGACAGNLFVMDAGYGRYSFPTYYVSKSLDYVLTLDGCKHHMASRQQIQTRLAERRPTDWFIVLESDLPAFAGAGSLTPVLTINPYQDQKATPFVLCASTTRPQ